MSDALKLRLSSLKKASVQLKSKVLNEPKINYESISAIMASILPEKEADQSLLTTPPQNNNSEAALARSKAATNSGSPPVSNTLTYSPTSSIFLVPASTIVNNSAPSQSMAARPLVEKVSRHERSSSNDSLISKDPLDCEIDKLRQQNEEIEAQML